MTDQDLLSKYRAAFAEMGKSRDAFYETVCDPESTRAKRTAAGDRMHAAADALVAATRALHGLPPENRT